MTDVETKCASVQKKLQRADLKKTEVENELMQTQRELHEIKTEFERQQEHHHNELSTVKMTASGLQQ